jgi:hypothetical protein
MGNEQSNAQIKNNQIAPVNPEIIKSPKITRKLSFSVQDEKNGSESESELEKDQKDSDTESEAEDDDEEDDDEEVLLELARLPYTKTPDGKEFDFAVDDWCMYGTEKVQITKVTDQYFDIKAYSGGFLDNVQKDDANLDYIRRPECGCPIHWEHICANKRTDVEINTDFEDEIAKAAAESAAEAEFLREAGILS